MATCGDGVKGFNGGGLGEFSGRASAGDVGVVAARGGRDPAGVRVGPRGFLGGEILDLAIKELRHGFVFGQQLNFRPGLQGLRKRSQFGLDGFVKDRAFHGREIFLVEFRDDPGEFSELLLVGLRNRIHLALKIHLDRGPARNAAGDLREQAGIFLRIVFRGGDSGIALVVELQKLHRVTGVEISELDVPEFHLVAEIIGGGTEPLIFRREFVSFFVVEEAGGLGFIGERFKFRLLGGKAIGGEFLRVGFRQKLAGFPLKRDVVEVIKRLVAHLLEHFANLRVLDRGEFGGARILIDGWQNWPSTLLCYRLLGWALGRGGGPGGRRAGTQTGVRAQAGVGKKCIDVDWPGTGIGRLVYASVVGSLWELCVVGLD